MQTHQGHKSSHGTDWFGFTAYGSGDFALNLFWQGTGFYLFFFFTNVAGLPSTTVGTMFLLAAIWDAVSDPLMGYIADRTKTRWGSYRPYLIGGALPLCGSFMVLFTPLGLGPGLEGALAAGFLLVLFRTAYTVVSIPYSSLGARITRNFHMRTRLSAIRMYFGFLGGISITFLAKKLQEHYADAEAFHYMGLIAGAAAIVVLVVCFFATAEADHPIGKAAKPPAVGDSLRALLSNTPFLIMAAGISLVTIATTTVGQTMLYYFEARFGDRGAGNNAILIMSMAPLVTIPLWSMAALRLGKKEVWILGSGLGIAGMAMLAIFPPTQLVLSYVAITIVVVGLSSYALLFWSMLPDTIEYGQYRTKVPNESFLIGVASSFQKLSIGLSAFLLGLLLDSIGYRPEAALAAETADGIALIFTLVPSLALGLSILLIVFYPISAQSHGDMVSRLREETPDTQKSSSED